mgnify:CR=1 FL=1
MKRTRAVLAVCSAALLGGCSTQVYLVTTTAS